MASFKPPPIDKISDRQGRLAEAFEIVRRCFRPIVEFLDEIGDTVSDTVPGGGGGGPASDLATRKEHSWVANGPYRVDTSVDGGWGITTPMSITKLKLTRTTPGTAGSTILDLNRNGTTLYTVQGNRPTILYTQTEVSCALPDVVDLLQDDVITVDTDQKETGHPQGWELTLEGA